jgi:hypothetical protein
MGELMGAVAAGQASMAEQAAWVARVEAEDARKRRLAAGRIEEFIGALSGKEVPTLPLYQRHTSRGLRDRQDRDGVRKVEGITYTHLGDGWLAREKTPPYDDTAHKTGLFIATSGLVYRCGYRIDTAPPDDTEGVITGPHYMADGDVTHYPDAPDHGGAYPSQDKIILELGEDAGLRLLADALATRYGITG